MPFIADSPSLMFFFCLERSTDKPMSPFLSFDPIRIFSIFSIVDLGRAFIANAALDILDIISGRASDNFIILSSSSFLNVSVVFLSLSIMADASFDFIETLARSFRLIALNLSIILTRPDIFLEVSSSFFALESSFSIDLDEPPRPFPFAIPHTAERIPFNSLRILSSILLILETLFWIPDFFRPEINELSDDFISFALLSMIVFTSSPDTMPTILASPAVNTFISSLCFTSSLVSLSSFTKVLPMILGSIPIYCFTVPLL